MVVLQRWEESRRSQTRTSVVALLQLDGALVLFPNVQVTLPDTSEKSVNSDWFRFRVRRWTRFVLPVSPASVAGVVSGPIGWS